jgi:hypothetical protein
LCSTHCGHSLKGNDNAVGNPGNPNPTNPAGPGNGRAISHGAKASPFNLVNHLGEDDVEWIDRITQAYMDDADWDADHPELENLRFVVILMWQRWSATDVLLEEGQSEDATIGVSEFGEPIIKTDEHHLGPRQLSLSREIRQELSRLGFSNSAEDRQADATADIAQAWADQLRETGTGDRT